MVSCFLPHSKKHLIRVASISYLWNINKLLGKFIGVKYHLQNVWNFINFVSNGTFNLRKWMQMTIRLQNHRKQGFSIMLFSYGHHLDKRKVQFQTLESRIEYQGYHIMNSSFIISCQKERKKSITLMTSLMLLQKSLIQ